MFTYHPNVAGFVAGTGGEVPPAGNGLVRGYNDGPPSPYFSIHSLFEKNMKGYYKSSKQGYDPVGKIQELFTSGSRYFTIPSPERAGTGKPDLLAFTHFQVCLEPRTEPPPGSPPGSEPTGAYLALYVLDIQVDQTARGRGLGKAMLDGVEKLGSMLTAALANEMRLSGGEVGGDSPRCERILLTVFKANGRAMEFYGRQGYEVDGSDPSKYGEFADYNILSKRI